MEKPNILYGICGIGSGHTNRQKPIVEHFSQKARMVIFGYGNSLDYYSKRFADDENVLVQPVAVPFYVGNKHGLDFAATAQAPQNQGVDFFKINSTAFAAAQDFLGRPDLVVTDYEPNSADYGHAHRSPVVTFDQQSKYFVGGFPQELNGTYYQDEVARLSMMFRHAEARLACSFFKVPRRKGAKEEIKIYPPIIKELVLNLRREVSNTRSILLYITKQGGFGQSIEDVRNICRSQRDSIFHIFAPDFQEEKEVGSNMVIYPHGHPDFKKVLAGCSGIVSTAGHTLLSEAMHLGIPVYAMPLSIYEQQMNAKVIGDHDFGINSSTLSSEKLAEFIDGLEDFSLAIRSDTKVLLKGSDGSNVIEFLESEFSI